MNSEHAAVKERTILFSHCLVLVFGIDVLENLFGVERIAIVVVSLNPKSRRKVIFIVRDVNVVFSEIFFKFLQCVFSTYLQKTPLVSLTLHDLLLGQFSNATHWSCRSHQILLFSREQLALFWDCLLPFPAKVRKLVTGLQKLLGWEHSFALVVFFGGGGLGVKKVFDAVKHWNINIIERRKKRPPWGLNPRPLS